MKRRALLLALPAAAQLPERTRRVDDERERDLKLPNGKSQKDEILKADREKNIEEVRQLAKLAVEVRDEIEKTEAFVLPLATIKKTEEIEKLAKRIRGRLRHY